VASSEQPRNVSRQPSRVVSASADMDVAVARVPEDRDRNAATIAAASARQHMRSASSGTHPSSMSGSDRCVGGSRARRGRLAAHPPQLLEPDD